MRDVCTARDKCPKKFDGKGSRKKFVQKEGDITYSAHLVGWFVEKLKMFTCFVCEHFVAHHAVNCSMGEYFPLCTQYTHSGENSLGGDMEASQWGVTCNVFFYQM